jgi:hypothetical protein
MELSLKVQPMDYIVIPQKGSHRVIIMQVILMMMWNGIVVVRFPKELRVIRKFGNLHQFMG